MIDEKRIAEIRERVEAATPGPWRTVILGNTVKSLQIISHSICKKICSGISPKSKDADFIIHSREDIPYLLDELESLQAMLDATIAGQETLQRALAEVTEIRNNCAAAARAIALWLKEFCDENLSYETMIADAARKVSDALAEVRRRERAAVEALVEQLKHPIDDICSLCQHHVKCAGKNCPEYVEGQGGTINGEQADFEWTCEEFNFGTCAVLENTPCNGCFDNDYRGFKWIGLKEAGEKG